MAPIHVRRCWRWCRPSWRLDRATDTFPFIARCDWGGTELSDAYTTDREDGLQSARRLSDPFPQIDRTPPRIPVGGGVVVSGLHIVAPLEDDPPRPAPATDALRRLRTHSSVVNIGQFHLKNQQLALKKFSSSRKKNVVLKPPAQSSTVRTLGASRRRACALAVSSFLILDKTRHFCNGIKLANFIRIQRTLSHYRISRIHLKTARFSPQNSTFSQIGQFRNGIKFANLTKMDLFRQRTLSHCWNRGRTCIEER